MDLTQLWAYIGKFLTHPVAFSWLLLMAIALGLALLASMPPRRPLGGWLGDFFIKWGLAGIFVWFVINGFWALRELLNMRLIIPFTPIESYLEYATVWSAVLTGVATFIFFGSALLLRAIFSREELPKGVIYYRQEVFIADANAVLQTASQTAAGKEPAEEGRGEAKAPVVVIDNRKRG
ncbi:MAG: hypothetical protein ACK4SY_09000 [Pyrobaculum sp.]